MTTIGHSDSFAKCFEALTGYAPLCWQKRLFDRLANGSVPPVVDLPTGLGKTSVIPIWLIALASIWLGVGHERARCAWHSQTKGAETCQPPIRLSI